MPKRVQCSDCGKSLLHKIKYKIVEVEGTGSGKTQRVIATLCKECSPLTALKGRK